MLRNTIKIAETLILRRIDPVLILRKYLAGDYKNTIIPTEKITLSKAFLNVNSKIGNDQTSELYRFSDKTNSGQLIITSNHEQYKYSCDTINNDKPISYCKWCRREIKGIPLGIPISMEKERNSNIVYFNVEDTYDTFGCALASLKRIYSCHYMYKDPLYMDAEQLLHCLYHKMHPNRLGTRIKEAGDWRLLKYNGGPLEDEEYDSEQYQYVQLTNIVTVPIKRQFIKLNIKPVK